MNITEEYLSIPLEQIVDSNTFTIHSFLDGSVAAPELAESILRHGILSPPIIIGWENTGYDVICGRQRLFCADSLLNKKTCLCRVLPGSTDKKSILLLLLEDQFTCNELTLIEQADFLTLCRKLIPENNQFKEFWQSIPAGRISKGLNYLDNFTKLNAVVKRKMHCSVLSEKTAVDLQKFNQADQFLLTDLIETLQLGLNNQKKIICDIKDAISRREISLSDFLNDTLIKGIITDQEINQSQKTAKLFDLLFTMNYPLFSKASESFTRRVKALSLPETCKLSSAKAFEKDEVQLTIRYKNLETFEKIWPDLKDLITKK
jgi:hypothetical protein